MKTFSSTDNIHRVKLGKTYWFEYHCQDGHDSADAKLWCHSHQKASYDL
jgi:hypothetical protein